MNFYQKLGSFEDFTDLTDDSHFTRIPDDWWVVVADIQGSTQAVEEGRYRDVNTLGAAAIVVVHETLGEGTFPFVFGGDGATMVIPPDQREAVEAQLAGLQALAADHFHLAMRIGAVRIADLGGAHVDVAKLRIAGDRCLAVFRGGGLTRAEELIKGGGHPLVSPENRILSPDLAKLSCRWQPIPPRQDYSLTLLVRSQAGHEVYGKVLSALSDLYGGSIEHANPIHTGKARYRTIRQCLADEKRYHRSRWSPGYLWRMVEITVAVLIFGHGMPGPFGARKYTESMGRHSDYRKFDDMLRMVIDCSEEQLVSIRQLLEKLHQDGEIHYGMHLSKETLMTCFFHGPGEGRHLHFIDGGEGGYTMAAKYLKKQMGSQ